MFLSLDLYLYILYFLIPRLSKNVCFIYFFGIVEYWINSIILLTISYYQYGLRFKRIFCNILNRFPLLLRSFIAIIFFCSFYELIWIVYALMILGFIAIFSVPKYIWVICHQQLNINKTFIEYEFKLLFIIILVYQNALLFGIELVITDFLYKLYLRNHLPQILRSLRRNPAVRVFFQERRLYGDFLILVNLN